MIFSDMSDSRVYNSLKNYGMNVFAQIASILLSFIGRTFFIKILSIDYLGVNGLFSNILSLLSLAELGIGTAITYMMYKPIADNNVAKVVAYNQLFKKIYNIIGLVVLVVGLIFTPFIYLIIKEEPDISENLYIIYVLFVCNSSISYFFTYKRSLLIAYQKEYINSANNVQFALIREVLLIILLLLFRNFYIYLAAQIFITFLSNLAISLKVNKLFPEILAAKSAGISKDEIHTIIKNTAGMVCHKIGSVVVSGTSNIFISYFVGIASVGIYTNYVLISKCAQQVIGNGVNSLTASFGNLVAMSDNNEVKIVFNKIYFINFLIAYFISVLFFVLVAPFIKVWIGDEYLLNNYATLIIAINTLFFNQIRIPYQIIINTYGLFWQIRWKSIIEAILSIIFSLIFAAWFKWGITGILLSAMFSNILTSLWWEPYVALKHGIKQLYKDFVKKLVFSIMILLGTITFLSVVFNVFDNSISGNGWIELTVHLIISVAFMMGIICLVFGKTQEYEYIYNLITKMLFNARRNNG